MSHYRTMAEKRNTGRPGSSSNRPRLSTNRGFKKSGNGQGGQPRVSPAIVSPDTNTTATARSVQNSSHGQPPLHVDMTIPKTTVALPEAPCSQSTAGTSGSVPPSTRDKGNVAKPFTLQFGSMSPSLLNGLQLPARTTSAPPNLDEQKKQGQVHQEPLKEPTLPTAPCSNGQQQLPRKDVGSSNQSATRDSNPPVQIKTELHPHISNAGVAPPPKPPTLPIPGISAAIPFQQPQASVQFGCPGPQQIPMSLPIGNVPFVPHLQPSPLQPQAMVDPAQGLGCNQISYQPTPQFGNFGIGMPAQQFAKQQQGTYIAPHNASVKITHPETHADFRLDQTDLCTHGGSSGQRPPPITTSQQIPSFTMAHYCPQLQPISYLFPPSNPWTTTSHLPGFSYPFGITNPSAMNSMPSCTYVPASYCFSESGIIHPPVSVPSAQIQGGLKPTIPFNYSVGGFSVTGSMPASMAETPMLLKSPVLTSNTQQPILREVLGDGSLQQFQADSETPGAVTLPMVSQHSATATSVAPSAPAAPAGDSGTVVAVTDGRKKGPVRKSNSLEDWHKKSSEKDVGSSHPHQLIDVSPSEADRNLSTVNMSKNGCSEDNKSRQFLDVAESTTTANPSSQGAEASIIAEAIAGETTKRGAVPAALGSYGIILKKEEVPTCSDSIELVTNGEISIKDTRALEASTTARLGMNGSITKDFRSAIHQVDHPSSEVDPRIGLSRDMEHRKTEVTGTFIPDCSNAKVHPAPTAGKSSGSLNPVLSVTAEDRGESSLENPVIYDKQESEKQQLAHVVSASSSGLPAVEGIKASVRSTFKATNKAARKRYTREFLLSFSDKCTDPPIGFKIGPDITTLISVRVSSSHVTNPDNNYSPGRKDRSLGASHGDRRMIGNTEDDKWFKGSGSFNPRDPRGDVGYAASLNIRPGHGVNHGLLMNHRGQSSKHFVGGILSDQMQLLTPQGGLLRNNSDVDRWRSGNSRGLMPSPQTPMQLMHRADNRYEVGKVADKEAAKQRKLKAILNKLTPQNFEKLFEQVKEVNIDNPVTLAGVISQIFDKALMEPTFCEMYANFCFHLSFELPEFKENDEKITFRGLLITKCQEEYERVEKEQAEADKVEEEGEITPSEAEREEKRIKARRRMLGNIRLIGELYKKKMLTEKIMHKCINEMLGNYENPDEENLEALCKLMSTIGEIIDHIKAKQAMDTYYNMMLKLSTNQKLSSRVRFMLRDAIDLRKNKWQERRKIDGPKKIDQVHRDAAQERQTQAGRLSRGPSINSAMRRGQPIDYNTQVSTMLPSPSSQVGGMHVSAQVSGYGIQDKRLEDRRPLSLLQNLSDGSSVAHGRQSSLAGGVPVRGQASASNIPLAEPPLIRGNHHRMISGQNSHNSAPYSTTMRTADRLFGRSTTCTVPGEPSSGSLAGSSLVASDAKPLSKDVLCEKSISTIREFYSAKDEKELALCIKELNSPSFYPSMVSIWVIDSFERKDMERDLLAKLLVNLCNSRDGLLSQAQLTQGFESVLSSLEDAVNDAPRATEFLGRIFAKLISENVVTLQDAGRLIREGGEEPGRLLEIGLASDVLGNILEIIKIEKGDAFLGEIRTSSDLNFSDFLPPHPVKSKKLDPFL